MHTLSTLFPAAFPALALSHFVALLSPGPDFFCWSATPCATGSAAASDCVSASPQAMRCILCSPSSAGASAPGAAAFLLIELLGAGYLLWIGSLLIRSRPATLAMESVRAARPGFGRQLLLGLGSSLLNPKTPCFIWR